MPQTGSIALGLFLRNSGMRIQVPLSAGLSESGTISASEPVWQPYYPPRDEGEGLPVGWELHMSSVPLPAPHRGCRIGVRHDERWFPRPSPRPTVGAGSASGKTKGGRRAHPCAPPWVPDRSPARRCWGWTPARPGGFETSPYRIGRPMYGCVMESECRAPRLESPVLLEKKRHPAGERPGVASGPTFGKSCQPFHAAFSVINKAAAAKRLVLLLLPLRFLQHWLKPQR